MDGTLWRDDEMIAQGVGRKTGPAHGPCQHERPRRRRSPACAACPSAGAIFIHVNNTNPALLADSPERAELERAGWEVAYDGMELSL